MERKMLELIKLNYEESSENYRKHNENKNKKVGDMESQENSAFLNIVSYTLELLNETK